MEIKGGNYVSQIKRLSDRILEQILAEKNIDAFNGAQGRILYVLWSRDGISPKSIIANREATGGSHSFEEDTKAGERYFRHQLKTL